MAIGTSALTQHLSPRARNIGALVILIVIIALFVVAQIEDAPFAAKCERLHGAIFSKSHSLGCAEWPKARPVEERRAGIEG